MNWEEFIIEESKKEYFINLMKEIDKRYEVGICYPPKDEIFNAFNLCPLNEVKVVILGQDPYHEINQAHGLAFSTKSKKLPPSLKNIYKEMANDLNTNVNQGGDLSYLASQGVLLLNTILTVEDGKALSHKGLGWEIFTDNVLKHLNKLAMPIVYILWGNEAKSKLSFLDNSIQLKITSCHPSPLSASRGFFGSKPFSKCNEYLKTMGKEEINWIDTNINEGLFSEIWK